MQNKNSKEVFDLIQCKVNHGIMPFWANMTESKAREIGFEVLEVRKASYCIMCKNYQYALIKGTGTIDNLCNACGNHTLNIYSNKDKPFIPHSDVRKKIKVLDNNITNVVSRRDGTLEINVKKQSEDTKSKVLRFINQKCLNDCFTKIDFHEVGEVA